MQSKNKKEEIKVAMSGQEKQKIKKSAEIAGLSMNQYLLKRALGTENLEPENVIFFPATSVSKDKTQTIKIRVNPKEKQQIKESAELVGLSMSQYLLSMGLGVNIEPKEKFSIEHLNEFFSQFSLIPDSVNSKSAKTERINIKVSPEDKQKIQEFAQAANLSVSQYLIISGLGQKMQPEIKNALLSIYKELNYWGNNLNQIAKGINEARIDHRLALYKQTQREIASIEQHIDHLKTEMQRVIA